jgi:hypothetical protein
LISYEHKQKSGKVLWFSVIATLIVTVVLVAALCLIFSGVSFERLSGKIAFLIWTLLFILPFGFSVWATLIYTSLTVKIEDGFLKLKFGPGLFKKKFALKDIASAESAKTDFWQNWGIRLYRNGWLYNIAGFDAVEIKMKNGKINAIGTDQPQELAAAINNSI